MKGIKVKCICCGEEDSVFVNVADVDSFRCTSCDNEFTREEVQTMMDAWKRLFTFLDKFPTVD